MEARPLIGQLAADVGIGDWYALWEDRLSVALNFAGCVFTPPQYHSESSTRPRDTVSSLSLSC